MTVKNTIDISLQLVELCKAGNRKAQFDLYNLYAKAMYNTCLRIVSFQEDAEDVMQESFLEAFTKIHTFRAESTFGAWLKTIVVNKAITKLRKRRLVFEDISLHAGDLLEENKNDIEENTFVIQKIKTCLNLLPEGFRVVLNLYLFEGYDHQEIGQILGINESTSRSQFLRGKNKLLALIAE